MRHAPFQQYAAAATLLIGIAGCVVGDRSVSANRWEVAFAGQCTFPQSSPSEPKSPWPPTLPARENGVEWQAAVGRNFAVSFHDERKGYAILLIMDAAQNGMYSEQKTSTRDGSLRAYVVYDEDVPSNDTWSKADTVTIAELMAGPLPTQTHRVHSLTGTAGLLVSEGRLPVRVEVDLESSRGGSGGVQDGQVEHHEIKGYLRESP